MKKFSFLFMIFAVFMLVLAACGGNNTADDTENAGTNEAADSAYEPEEIDSDNDVCEVCGMAIDDDQYATEIILENDKVLKFDDLGDLYVWLDENQDEEIGAAFVRDFNTKEWVHLEDATYVHNEEEETPMGFNVISFENSDDAESYIEENKGELMSSADLEDREWEEDHDSHDNHDDHDDHEDNENHHENHDEDND